MTHTSFPPTLRAEDGLTVPGLDGDHYLIVDDAIGPTETYPHYAGEAPTLALATLYASAPALLAACEAMMAAFEEPGNPVLYTGPMLAAIAKAKGETE
jgi:hypothetical protein